MKAGCKPNDITADSARALEDAPAEAARRAGDVDLEARETQDMAAEDPRSAPSTIRDDVWTEEPTSDQLYPNSKKIRELVRRRREAPKPIDSRPQPSDEAHPIPPPPAPHEEARRPRPAKELDSPTDEEVKEHMLTHLPYRR